MLRDRREFLALLAGLCATPAVAQAPSPEMSRPTAYAFSFKRLEGGTLRLAEHAGKPILVVNTASLCGYTPQYTGLQQLWTRFGEQGLLVIGVPSNDFGGQEPGGPAEIDHVAHQEYGVTFPLTEKVAVKGGAATPSTNGRRPNTRSRRAGTSINIWWGATVILPPPSPPTSSPWMRELWQPFRRNCGHPQADPVMTKVNRLSAGPGPKRTRRAGLIVPK
jgi:glutathione peroxidase